MKGIQKMKNKIKYQIEREGKRRNLESEKIKKQLKENRVKRE